LQGRRVSAPDNLQKKVGADPPIVTISVEEFEHLKFQLEESERNISQKQNELQHTKKRAIRHQQQVQEQLTTAIDKEVRVRQHQRETQATPERDPGDT